MRKLAAIGLAGALATATVGASTSSAQATTPGAFFWGAAIAVGALVLLHHHRPFVTTRAYAYDPGYPLGYVSAHAAWCKAHYPNTYNSITNTFIGNDRRVHVCISPY